MVEYSRGTANSFSVASRDPENAGNSKYQEEIEKKDIIIGDGSPNEMKTDNPFKCSKCGGRITLDQRFCPHCGNRLKSN
jgi:DNA-directed RNA polymerase subunit RPC12/RpoP